MACFGRFEISSATFFIIIIYFKADHGAFYGTSPTLTKSESGEMSHGKTNIRGGKGVQWVEL